MSQPGFDHALTVINEVLAPIGISWTIIGSTSLYLLGYDVQPNDIDIAVSKENAAVINRALQAYKVDFVNHPGSKFRSVFTKYLIGDVNVEVMGGLEINTPSGWMTLDDYIQNPIKIEHRGCIFTVPGVGDQKRIYMLFGRAKDERIIAMLG